MDPQLSHPQKSYPGTLITFEGIDGSGKSTLAQHVFRKLCSQENKTFLTKEPGSTPLGSLLRNVLHEQKNMVGDLAEYLLFAADRAQHFETVVIPALQSGNIVLSDRMADSSLAYQGYGRGLDCTMIKKVNAWAMQHIEPDLTFYLDITIATALERVFLRNEEITSFEQEKQAFWEKVQHGFDTIFQNRKNVVRLSGELSTQELTDQVITHISNYHATQ